MGKSIEGYVRPKPVISEEALEELFLHVAAGGTVREYCEGKGFGKVDRSSFYALLAADPEVADVYARAKRAGIEALADDLITIADDGRNDFIERTNRNGETYTVLDREHVSRSTLRISTRQWILERLAAGKYSTRVAHIGGGPGEPAIAHDVSVSPREDLEARLNAMAERGKK